MSDDIIQKLTVYKLTDVTLNSVQVPKYKLVGNGTWKANDNEFPYRLYFYKTAPQPAKWLPVFQPLNLDIAADDCPKTMAAGFILVIQVGTSLYGITGGLGHIDLRKCVSIEYRFGIKLAQRILALPELRGLSQRDTSGIVNALDRVFRGLYNPCGDINNLKRVLTHVRGTLRKQNPLRATIGRSIQASDALTVNGSKTFQEIITFLVEVDYLFTHGHEQITIPQLEYVDKKRHGALLAELESQLVAILAKYDPDTTHSLFLDNADIGYLPDRVISYVLHYNRQKHKADTFEEVFERIQSLLAGIPLADERCAAFRRMNLRVDFDDGNSETRSLSYFLCGDIAYNNNVYFLNNEQWYRASDEFIKTMTRELDNIECLDPAVIGLKEWDTSQFPEERDFNAAHKDMLVLDRHLVKIADEKGGIEFCDLLKTSTDWIYLVHVKHKTGAALRSLFAQGFVSAKLYAESEEFREKISTGAIGSNSSAITQEEKKMLHNLKKRQRREMRVVFAIFDDVKSHTVSNGASTTSAVLKGTLSTFAKVDLLCRVTDMRAMGYNVVVSRIKPYPPKLNE